MSYMLQALWLNITRCWPRSIKRVLDYLPVLWYDWDFESFGAYRLLKKKLERLEPCIRNGTNENRAEDADLILQVIDVLDRLIQDDYYAEECAKLDKEWESPDFVFVPTGDGLYEIVDRALERRSKKEQEQRQEVYQKAIEQSQLKEKEDREFVFNTLRDNISFWWD